MVKEFDIDLREVNSYVERMDELSIIIRALKKQRLFGRNFLYSGFEGLKIPNLKKGISYRKDQSSIFAFNSDNLRWYPEQEKRGLVDYCDICAIPAMAIWNARSFHQDYECQRYEYLFNEGRNVFNSLKGIARLI
ncbi:MAG: hypothetical protein WC494_00120 [Candidatus Pacearchaeota archaeon]